jgi:hypothetical protein
MRKHTLLPKNAQSERSKVCHLVAKAAHFQLHVHSVVPFCIFSTAQSQKVQGYAVRLGVTKLPFKAEDGCSVLDWIAFRKVLQL